MGLKKFKIKIEKKDLTSRPRTKPKPSRKHLTAKDYRRKAKHPKKAQD